VTVQGSVFFHKQTAGSWLTNEPFRPPPASCLRSSSVRLPPIFLFKAAGRAALILSRLATVALMLALPVVKGGISSDDPLASIICAEDRWQTSCKA